MKDVTIHVLRCGILGPVKISFKISVLQVLFDHSSSNIASLSATESQALSSACSPSYVCVYVLRVYVINISSSIGFSLVFTMFLK